jgi:hypothetical protein
MSSSMFEEVPLSTPRSPEDLMREHEVWERDVAPWVDAIAGPALGIFTKTRNAPPLAIETGEYDD